MSDSKSDERADVVREGRFAVTEGHTVVDLSEVVQTFPTKRAALTEAVRLSRVECNRLTQQLSDAHNAYDEINGKSKTAQASLNDLLRALARCPK